MAGEEFGSASGTKVAMLCAGVTVRQDHKANGDIAILFDVTLKTAPQGWRRHGRDICYMVGVYVEGGYAGGTDPEGVWELDAPVMLKKATAGSEILVTVQARSHLCLKACTQACQVMPMPANHADLQALCYTVAIR